MLHSLLLSSECGQLFIPPKDTRPSRGFFTREDVVKRKSVVAVQEETIATAWAHSSILYSITIVQSHISGESIVLIFKLGALIVVVEVEMFWFDDVK